MNLLERDWCIISTSPGDQETEIINLTGSAVNRTLPAATIATARNSLDPQ